jgi:hypothetical protein
MTNAEIEFIMDAIESTASHFQEWAQDYKYDLVTNEFNYHGFAEEKDGEVEKLLDLVFEKHVAFRHE